MDTNLGERLRVVGQWLDVHAAQGAEITHVNGSVCICCLDDKGVEQRLAITDQELLERSEEGRRWRRNPFGMTRGRWSARLRTMGQRLEVQDLEPTRIWSHEDHLYVRVQYEQQGVELDYLVEELDNHDRVERNQRLVQSLRRRKTERWWDNLRVIRSQPQVSTGS